MTQSNRFRIHRPSKMGLCAALLVLIATCAGVDNVSISAEGKAVIPQRSVIDDLIGALSFTGFQGFDITQSQEFRNQGYTKEQIDSVRMESFTLVVESPQGGNFDFLESIRFYASADGLPEVLIAELDPVPDGQSTLYLEVDSSVELQPYVVAPSVNITTSATGVRPPEETTVNADAVFNIDINVTGACE